MQHTSSSYSKERMDDNLKSLDKVNQTERNIVRAEIGRIKRAYIKKYGMPLFVGGMTYRGIATEGGSSRDEDMRPPML